VGGGGGGNCSLTSLPSCLTYSPESDPTTGSLQHNLAQGTCHERHVELTGIPHPPLARRTLGFPAAARNPRPGTHVRQPCLRGSKHLLSCRKWLLTLVTQSWSVETTRGTKCGQGETGVSPLGTTAWSQLMKHCLKPQSRDGPQVHPSTPQSPHL
jgi:hypothetical protein